MPTYQKPPMPVRLPEELKEWVKTRATSNMRSVNAEIIALLLNEKRTIEVTPDQK